MFFDTHAHLDDKQFDEDRDKLIRILGAMGVSNLTNIGSRMETSYSSIKLAEEYDIIYAAVGVHPHYTKDMDEDDLQQLKKWLSHKRLLQSGRLAWIIITTAVKRCSKVLVFPAA